MLATVSCMEQAFDGTRVRTLREAAGLTLKALEALTGLSAAKLWRTEQGVRSPNLAELGAIAVALGVRPEDLVVEGQMERAPRPAHDPAVVRGRRYPMELQPLPRVPLLGMAPAAAEVFQLKGGSVLVESAALEGVARPAAVRIVGDDLAHLGLHNGETAIVDQDATWKDGEVYLIEFDHRVTFAKIHTVPGTELLRWLPAGEVWVEHAAERVRNLGQLCWIFAPPRRPSP